MGVVVWEIFTETIPWLNMNAVEIFTAVVINRERLNTDRIPWSVLRRLITNLFTNQPIHRHSCDKVILSNNFAPFHINLYILRSRRSFKELHYMYSVGSVCNFYMLNF